MLVRIILIILVGNMYIPDFFPLYNKVSFRKQVLQTFIDISYMSYTEYTLHLHLLHQHHGRYTDMSVCKITAEKQWKYQQTKSDYSCVMKHACNNLIYSNIDIDLEQSTYINRIMTMINR